MALALSRDLPGGGGGRGREREEGGGGRTRRRVEMTHVDAAALTDVPPLT